MPPGFTNRVLISVANNYGPVNIGPGTFNGHQFGIGNQIYDHRGNGRIAAGVQANIGTPAPAPAPAPTPARAPIQRDPAAVVDLTNESSVQAPTAAAPEAKTILRAKPKSSFWKKGAQYLNKKLNNQSGTNVWRLFESMSALGPTVQKHRYCEAHWPTEEAAYEDILEMSKYFIDVSEMLMFASKWDVLDRLSAPEDASDETRLQREKLEKEIASEKSSLVKALPKKKRTKQVWEQHGQWSNWVRNLTRERFREEFDVKHSADNVKTVIAERERKIMQELAEASAVPKKRKANTVPAEVEGPSKKSKAEAVSAVTSKVAPTSESARYVGSDVDAEGEIDDEFEAEPKPSFDYQLANELVESIMADASSAPHSEPSPYMPGEIENDEEQVTALISSSVPVAKGEIASVQMDEGFFSVSPGNFDILQLEQAFVEQVTAPGSYTIEVPQEEHTAAAEELTVADIDSLFEDFENTTEDLPATTSGVAAAHTTEEVMSNEVLCPTPSTTQVTEDHLTPLTADEIAATTARRAGLAADGVELTSYLAEDRAELATLEYKLQEFIDARLKNPYFRTRTEGFELRKRAEIWEKERDVQQWEAELYEVEWEMAVLPRLPVVVEEEGLKNGDRPKSVTGSCGAS